VLAAVSVMWLKEGDRNTNFFHRKAIWRGRKNKIKKLRAPDGNWMDGEAELGNLITDYFRSMYLRENLSQQEEVINLFSPKVTDEMNGRLCCNFTDEEISDALFLIGLIKALGPDGFRARFFQRN
jgi:hypothetical protein